MWRFRAPNVAVGKSPLTQDAEPRIASELAGWRLAGWRSGRERGPADWEELSGLARAGIELGAHTRTHRELPALQDDEAEQEIRAAADDLHAATGVRPASFAYPHGRFGEQERLPT
jgi:peptidoglycan/xylan/chitin deacetylase (PgdA/CDA1 family)